MSHPDFARFVEIKEEWASAVGADDPDALDDWPVERIIDLERQVREAAIFSSDTSEEP